MPALAAFDHTMADAIDGQSLALSWSQLLGGQLAELAGQYKSVLMQPTLDFSALEPGGVAAQRMRQIIQQLPLVKSGDARVRITGVVGERPESRGIRTETI
jgi:uncharacterized protein